MSVNLAKPSSYYEMVEQYKFKLRHSPLLKYLIIYHVTFVCPVFFVLSRLHTLSMLPIQTYIRSPIMLAASSRTLSRYISCFPEYIFNYTSITASAISISTNILKLSFSSKLQCTILQTYPQWYTTHCHFQ